MLPRLLPLGAFLCVAAVTLAAGPDSLGRVFDPPTRSAPGRSIPSPHGSIERLDPAFDRLVAPGAQMEKLAEGFNWSEGPTWLPRERAIVFSDVPENIIYKWSARKGLEVFIQPSGYTGHELKFREQGSNGLTTDGRHQLVVCQHGDRRISHHVGGGRFEPLVEFYQGRRFNSPNDLTFDRRGNLYFTDPPYGLEGLNQSPLKELMFNGVYLRRTDGSVTLLTRELTFPNGIALSPDGRTLYVNQSDPAKPVIMAYPVQADGTLEAGKVLFDTTPLMATGKGLPDGLKVDRDGNVFATGPGGVLVLNSEGKLLGRLLTGEATGNCAWGDDGSTLYITADMYLLRIRTLTRGANWPQ
jgi:gluconolactonase